MTLNAIPALCFSFYLVASPVISAPAPKDLAPMLQPILEESKLPSLAAAIVIGDEIRGIGATGVRKLDDRTKVKVTDKYHLGSCTKTMTATLAAVMVEDGTLEWDTTIGDVLGKKIRKMHADYRDVTLEQLLAHVGGLPGKAPGKAWEQAYEDQGRLSATRQRLAFVKSLLSEKPDYQPGSKTVYSNQGYAVAGLMLETLARKPWEKLMQERIFKPLEMDSAGFREPARRRKVDQPWGHSDLEPIPPGPRADNPDAIGPGATVHASIGDWAKFARFHLQRKPGKLLKKAESFDKLHAKLENSGNHGIGGWLVAEDERYGGHFIQMAGSNTMWYALFWILPGKDRAIVVTTNSRHKDASPTCNQVVAELMGFE